jgi:hypothetical protein
MLLQRLLLQKSRGFAMWLFGSEVAFALLVGLSVMTVDLGFLIFLIYAAWCGAQFYDFDRQRAFNSGSAWSPSNWARFLVIKWNGGFSAGALLLGANLLSQNLWVGLLLIAHSIGSAYQVYQTVRYGWPDYV